MQISASGLFASLYRQDVWANNLANASTTAFKPDVPATQFREAARVEDSLGHLPSNRLLERLGGGVLVAPIKASFEQGSLEFTGDPFHVALEGEGFMVAQAGADLAGDTVHLTRDGRLARGRDGRLVLATTGQPILDIQNRPISLPGNAPITINNDGAIHADGVVIARIKLIEVEDRHALAKLGGGAYLADSRTLINSRPASCTLVQGSLERSGADLVKSLMAMTSAAREVEANAGMISHHDRLMDRAINVFGRVG